MQEASKIQTIYKFKNTCYRCFRVSEIPFLSDFCYGELLWQTKDGRDFCIAILFDNPTFDLIIETLKSDIDLQKKKINPQKILALVADKPNGKDYTADYPMCPFCKRKQRHFKDNTRTVIMEVPFATWSDFERLGKDDKVGQN